MKSVRFPYFVRNSADGASASMPVMPLTLSNADESLAINAMLDTGSAVNVLPLSVGLQLGLDWDKAPTVAPLTGNLSRVATRGIVLTGTINSFPPLFLGFAWAETDSVPFLQGQMNFFLEFEVCFFRAQAAFEVRPKQIG
jgi:hypothetical protein